MTTAEKRKACWYVVPDRVTATRCSVCIHSVWHAVHAVHRCTLHKMAVRWWGVCKDFNPKGGGR